MGTQKIEKLADLQEQVAIQRTALDTQKQALVDSILTEEIKAKIKEIDVEFSPQYDAVNEMQKKVTEIEKEVKDDVIASGETLKGTRLMAVYAKGRVSWDTKALDGYVVAHPEVDQFRKVGEPSVSIRKV